MFSSVQILFIMSVFRTSHSNLQLTLNRKCLHSALMV